VLSRQIATQREQIAALKALGYDNPRIGWHYFKFVFLIVVLGLVMGLVGGAALGHWFSGFYAEVFRFPVFHYRVRLDLIVAALCLTSLAAAAATWYAIQSTVRLTPAEAMQPPAPGNFKPFFLETWGLRHGLSPGAQMVLRHMQRRPLRTALTVMGIAVSMAVVVTGTFWRDTIDLLLNTRFHQVMRGDVSVSLIEAHPARVQYELARLDHVSAVEASRSVSVRLVHGVHVWRGALQGRAAEPGLQRILDTHKRSFIPPQDGVLLTDRLAERLHIQPGQMVRIEVQEGQRQVLELPVMGTVVEMMGMGAYIERRSLNRQLQEGDVVNQLTLAVDRGHEPDVLQRLRAIPHIAASFSKAALLRNIQEAVSYTHLRAHETG
jgi:putative ABC transport system permease protein